MNGAGHYQSVGYSRSLQLSTVEAHSPQLVTDAHRHREVVVLAIVVESNGVCDSGLA